MNVFDGQVVENVNDRTNHKKVSILYISRITNRTMTADLAALAGVIGLSFATSFGTELLQYLLVYRTSNFKTLKANIEKHAAKVEEAKDGSSASSAKAVKKREARLQGWEQEAGKQITAVNFKCGAIVC